MNELFVVLVEIKNETRVDGVFESEQLAREYVATLTTKQLEADPMNDYVEVNDGLYALIQKCHLNEPYAFD